MIFGAVFLAFAAFWVIGSSRIVPDDEVGLFRFFPIFGIPFCLVGLAMMGTPIWTWRSAKKTVYVITNERLLIFKGGRTLDIQTFLPDSIEQTTRREHADGTGDVFFSEQIYRGSKGRTRVIQIGFHRIREAKAVEERILKLAGTNLSESS